MEGEFALITVLIKQKSLPLTIIRLNRFLGKSVDKQLPNWSGSEGTPRTPLKPRRWLMLSASTAWILTTRDN